MGRGGRRRDAALRNDDPDHADTLLDRAEVDATRWEVERLRLNSWDSQQKGPDGTPILIRLHGARATLRRKHAEPAIRQLLADLATEIEPRAPQEPPTKRDGEGRMLLLSLPDMHFGKAAPDWDLDQAEALWQQTVDYFLARASDAWSIELVVLPVGNDVTHIDNVLGTTTSGTKVESLASWQRQFKSAARSYVYKITRARALGATVRVVMVQGNHGWHTDWSLYQYLAAYFRADPDVEFREAFADEYHFGREYIEWGKNLLGLTHKPARGEKLSTAMSHEQPQAWARTAGGWREWHIGHHHHRELKRPGSYIEEDGVMIRMSPALCEMDQYHRVGMWFSMRGAEAHVYERAGGRIDQYDLPRSYLKAA